MGLRRRPVFSDNRHRVRGRGSERQGLAQADLVGQQQPDLAVIVVVAEALRDESLLPRLECHALAVQGRLDQRRGGQRLLGLDVRQQHLVAAAAAADLAAHRLRQRAGGVPQVLELRLDPGDALR